MELKPNMYVRTKWGIAKYIHNLVTKETVYRVIDKKIIYDNVEDWEDCLLDNEILKASYNIIDILEVGDYVNGSEVLDFEKKYIEEKDTFVPIGVVTENCYLDDTASWIIEKNIKSVITHEQMEQMAYKVGE